MHEVNGGSGRAGTVPLAGGGVSSSRRLDSRLIVLCLLTLVALVLRAPLFGDPLVHTDEQFYLLVGDRMRHGALPFVDIWDRKPIGLFLIYEWLRSLGGDGVVQYQVGATVSAVLTAFLVWDLARQLTSSRNAFLGAVAYLAYLGLFDGAGGQSPVFYNLLVVLAVRVVAGIARPAEGAAASNLPLVAGGALAMVLFGAAIQVKYTAVFEGIYVGSVLWHRAAVKFRSRAAVLGAVMLWVGCALAPTLAAMAVYYRLGHLGEFVQANFLSVFSRHQAHLPALLRLVLTALALTPLAGCAVRGAETPAPQPVSAGIRPLLTGWALAAIGGYLLFGSYYNHYALPLLPPLCILGSRGFGVRRRLFDERVVLAVGLVIGCSLVGYRLYTRGNAAQLERLTALVQANLHGCLYVYEGPPILYKQTGACFVSRYVFPSHLNNSKEADAIGVNTLAETARILREPPSVIVMSDEARPTLTNFDTRKLVLQTVRANYRFIGERDVGPDHWLVYALKRPAAPGLGAVGPAPPGIAGE